MAASRWKFKKDGLRLALRRLAARVCHVVCASEPQELSRRSGRPVHLGAFHWESGEGWFSGAVASTDKPMPLLSADDEKEAVVMDNLLRAVLCKMQEAHRIEIPERVPEEGDKTLVQQYMQLVDSIARQTDAAVAAMTHGKKTGKIKFADVCKETESTLRDVRDVRVCALLAYMAQVYRGSAAKNNLFVFALDDGGAGCISGTQVHSSS